ncbi:MAG TPA: UTP--glucose-1-phosphate uridylyltransferase [Candidatus Microsaccharimonas sp.]|nr:UTP--glucose-1-phosphate uridylyltransferase [Candidatus Microsaccharimonas sp.]
MKTPTKAIICAAGIGSRFLPQTKAVPKEMLPLIDRPVIQLISEEAVAAGVKEIIIVINENKGAIENHFAHNDKLSTVLRKDGKHRVADIIENIPKMAKFTYVQQHDLPTGSARSVLNARQFLDDDEPFFVFYADDFFRSATPRAVQLLDAYARTGKSTISLIEVDIEDAEKYGMVAIGEDIGEQTYKISRLLEKPGAANAPSTFASVSGYLLTPDILPYIARTAPGKNGEITLADSIDMFAQENDIYGKFIDGIWHDTGDQLKYVEAQVDLMLEMPEFAPKLRSFLQQRLNDK